MADTLGDDEAQDEAHDEAQGDVPPGVGPEVFRELLAHQARQQSAESAEIVIDDESYLLSDIESVEEDDTDDRHSRVLLRNGVIIGGLTGAAIVAALATVRFRRRHH